MLAFLRLILKFYLARYPHEQKKSCAAAVLRMRIWASAGCRIVTAKETTKEKLRSSDFANADKRIRRMQNSYSKEKQRSSDFANADMGIRRMLNSHNYVEYR